MGIIHQVKPVILLIASDSWEKEAATLARTTNTAGRGFSQVTDKSLLWWAKIPGGCGKRANFFTSNGDRALLRCILLTVGKKKKKSLVYFFHITQVQSVWEADNKKTDACWSGCTKKGHVLKNTGTVIIHKWLNPITGHGETTGNVHYRTCRANPLFLSLYLSWSTVEYGTLDPSSVSVLVTSFRYKESSRRQRRRPSLRHTFSLWQVLLAAD